MINRNLPPSRKLLFMVYFISLFSITFTLIQIKISIDHLKVKFAEAQIFPRLSHVKFYLETNALSFLTCITKNSSSLLTLNYHRWPFCFAFRYIKHV